MNNMGIHADDAIDIIFGTMALESMGKEELSKMYPRKYYPTEISLMVSSGEYKNSDFENGFYIPITNK